MPTTHLNDSPVELESEENYASMQNLPGAKAARKAMENILDAKSGWAKQRKEMKEAFDFNAGDQWDIADKTALREMERPVVVFNYAKKHINMIVGSEIQNRQDIRFIPRNLDSERLPQTSSLGELETSAYNWVMDMCDGPQEISLAFRDMIIGGMGFTEIYTDSEIEKDIRILVRRIPPMEMLWDTQCKMQNLNDARWIARVKSMPLSQAIEMFSEREKELKEMAAMATGLSLDQQPEELEEITPIMYEEGRTRTNPGEMPGKKGMIAVIQYQWWEYSDMYIVQAEGEPEKEYPEDKYQQIKERAKQVGLKLQVVKQRRKVYKQIFIAGAQLPLTDAEELEVQPGGFTFKCMTGEWDTSERCYRGVLYQIMDPARWANKYLSQTIHIINSNPKGGLLAEADAFKDPTSVERDWARPNSIILVEKGALVDKRVEVKPITHLPDSTFRMWQESVEAISGVAGINPEMLGDSRGDLPALTMRQRMGQGMQINALYFDALTRFRKDNARTTMEFIREFISDGRLIRIGGAFNGQTLPLFREDLAPEYDIVLDEGLRSPNAKAEAWAGLQPILPVIIRSGFLVPELLDIIPALPQAIAVKMKQKMNQHGGQIPQTKRGGQPAGAGKPPPSPDEIQAKLAESQSKVDLNKAKALEVHARARSLDARTKNEQMKTIGDHAIKSQKARQDTELHQAKLAREAHQAHMEQQTHHADMMKGILGMMQGPGEPPVVKKTVV